MDHMLTADHQLAMPVHKQVAYKTNKCNLTLHYLTWHGMTLVKVVARAAHILSRQLLGKTHMVCPRFLWNNRTPDHWHSKMIVYRWINRTFQNLIHQCPETDRNLKLCSRFWVRVTAPSPVLAYWPSWVQASSLLPRILSQYPVPSLHFDIFLISCMYNKLMRPPKRICLFLAMTWHIAKENLHSAAPCYLSGSRVCRWGTAEAT